MLFGRSEPTKALDRLTSGKCLGSDFYGTSWLCEVERLGLS